MSYYNLSSVTDSQIYKKVYFSLYETNKKNYNPEPEQEQEPEQEPPPTTLPEYVTTTYISNSLFDFLSRFKQQIELSAEAWDTIKKIYKSI